MPLEGTYAPSSWDFVNEQVELYESSNGTAGVLHKGLPTVIITTRGARSGDVRKCVVMRVEHEGAYVAVASVGGAPTHPGWYHNVSADPRVELQDGPLKRDMVARELTGAERVEWWARAVDVFPSYEDYRKQTAGTRVIPLILVEPLRDQTEDHS